MQRVRQSQHVLEARFKEKKVLFSLKSYLPYILNRSACEIWDFCKRPRYVSDIKASLGRKYTVSAAKITEDVDRIILEMKRCGLIEECRKK